MQKLTGSKLPMLLKPGLQSLLTMTPNGIRTSSAKGVICRQACEAADSTAGAKDNGMLQSERKANSVNHHNN